MEESKQTTMAENEISKEFAILTKKLDNNVMDEQDVIACKLACVAEQCTDKVDVENFMVEGKLLMGQYKHYIADYIVQKLNGDLRVNNFVFRTKEQQLLHLFVGSHWCKISCNQMFSDFIKQVLANIGVGEIYSNNPRFIGDILTEIFFTVSQTMKQSIPADEVWVNMQNGTLVISAKGEVSLRDHRRDDNFTYCLPYPYDPQALAPLFQKYLDEVLPDSATQRTVLEFIAYCLTNTLKLEVMLVLYGFGSNGKSVLMSVVENLLGKQAVSNLSLTDLSTSDEKRAQIEGKLVNISHENEARNINNAVLKKLVSGEPVDVRVLYRGTHEIRHYAKMISSFNRLPRPENTYGYFRRWILMEFRQTIDSEHADTDLDKKLCRELPGILNMVIAAMQTLLSNRKIFISEDCKQSLENYKQSADSVSMYLKEWCETNYNSKTSGKELYNAYKNYCFENVFKPLGKTNFYERLVQIGAQRTVTHKTSLFDIKLLPDYERA